MKCGICGTDRYPNGALMIDIGMVNYHKRTSHSQQYWEARKASQAKRDANKKARKQQEVIEEVARQEGREALAMPVVTKAVSFRGTGPEGKVVYGVHDTSELRSWYDRGDGNMQFGQFGLARLMDIEPQAQYTGLQNQIDALQEQQTALLALAFDVGLEITVEHLEAVEAAGERAVERLRAEG